ncbi:MAG: hypothetical protein WC713_01985 [Candidatus Methylomirabilota bacterium]
MSTDRRAGVIGNAAIKVPCRVCATANLTLDGEQTIDGVAAVTGDRVLVTAQTSSINNGIYVCDTGAWTRATDFDAIYDVVFGTLIKVNSGTSNSGFWYVSTTTANPTPGTDAIDFGMASTTLAVISAFVQTLLNDATAADFRTSLGLGTMSTATATDYITKALLTATGDSVVASAASTPARLAATANVAAHATTMNLWAARENILTGAAVTVTDIADAPYAGAVTWVKMNDAHVWTDGAVFTVQGNANYTAAAEDWIRIYATTVSTFEVTVFKANGRAVSATSGITLGTPQATTSGTAIDFTSIPTGTKRITINFSSVSTNGTSVWLVQIGDAGGIETSGYGGGVGNRGAETTSAAGFAVLVASIAAVAYSGSIVLSLENSTTFTWAEYGVLAIDTNGQSNSSGGAKSLSAELDRVRITTVNGTDAFDAGEVNISYE